ncbi:MAG: ABC transporter permease [Mariniblastus sp.]|nr:ABC transporter permease [Mariniblastus sp.]
MSWTKLVIRYIQFHKLKTVVLVASIFLTTFLPITILILLSEFNEKIISRAQSTPMVIGAEGSPLDLTLHAIYFSSKQPDPIRFATIEEIRQTGWARPVPIYSRYTARQFPIVGTSLDYFQFRNLPLAEGESLSRLGDCVLGSEVARQLQLGPGDRLLSDPENILDLAGHYPLKMLVRGVLEPSSTPDDWGVFVDLKTSWVIEGLGHGHQNLEEETDDLKVEVRSDGTLQATAAVLPYMEITDNNIDSFHFHGETADFPITAVIAVAPDEKNETLLMGHFQVVDNETQLVQPVVVIDELMSLVFQVKKFFDLNAVLIALATLFLLILVLVLSQRLRMREMQTMFKLGCSRGTILRLQFSEIAILFLVSSVLVALAVWGVWLMAGNVVQSLLIGSQG